MIAIECFVDPACPFAWATSRWLANVSERRDVAVELRQMSLATLNRDIELTDAQRHHMGVSASAGRVLAAAGPDAFGALYVALGRRLHENGRDLDVELVREALSECGLDENLADVVDDPTFDEAVVAAHEISQEQLGERGGSPIVTIDDVTFFGPVITSIPVGDDADDLFDAIVTLANQPSFAQVQRHRSGPPTFEAR